MMRVEGLSSSTRVQLQGSTGSNREAVLERKIQNLKNQLNELNSKSEDELTDEEVTQKQKLQQQITKLEQELQQIQAEGEQEAEASTEKEGEVNPMHVKEDGLGDYIDEDA